MLNLGVEEIKTLKGYCEGFDLNGTEQVAFSSLTLRVSTPN